MAYNICLSASSLHHPFCISLSSSINYYCKSKNLNFSFTRPTTRTSDPNLHISHVSLQDPHQQTIVGGENLENPVSSNGSPSKPYVWVNPNSPRASRLRKTSYDARYAYFVKLAGSLNSCEPNEDDVFKVLSVLGDSIVEHDAGLIMNNLSNPEVAVLALKFFQERVQFKKEVIIYNVALKVCRNSKDFQRAESLFDEMLKKGVKPDNATFSTIISCARHCNLPHKAVEWFEKMPSFGIKPDDITYSALIDSYGKAGKVEMALSLYDRARTEKWRLDVATFATVIKIYGLAGNFDGCLNVYEEMKVLGMKPNPIVYITLLVAMSRAKRPWQAKKIYEDMIGNGISPSYATYATLLRVYSRARYVEDALNIYREMKNNKFILDVTLYNALLSMCADLAYVDEAVDIFGDMKSSGITPDSWTFSSMIKLFSRIGKISEAEKTMNDMEEAGFKPTIYVLTSIVQCYGKLQRTDDVVRTFNQVLESDINPDDRFCGCLLSVMTHTPNEEVGKLVQCIERANPKLGHVVRLLLGEQGIEGDVKVPAAELFDSVSPDVKRAYLNCLMDLCINFNKLERACDLLDLGMSLEIYKGIQTKSSTQWSLHLKTLSSGAALTALHVWMNDLSKALEDGEELPPLFGINTGHGKHKLSDRSLAYVLESHLKELNAPFHEAPDQVGWFLTTKDAAQSWLESRKLSA